MVNKVSYCGYQDYILVSGIDVMNLDLNSMNSLFESYCLEILGENLVNCSMQSFINRNFTTTHIENFLHSLDYKDIEVTYSSTFEKRVPQLVFYKLTEQFGNLTDLETVKLSDLNYRYTDMEFLD